MHKLLYSHKWLSVYQSPQAIPYVICPNGVMIVALTPEGSVILIHEPTAYGEDAFTLLLPGGVIEQGEAMPAAANRELQEEIGFAAARLDWIGEIRPWVKYLDASINIYLARDLTPSRLQGDENYDIVQEIAPLASFESLIASRRLVDASTISALFLARQWLGAHA